MAQPEKRRSVLADWVSLVTSQPALWMGAALMSYLGGRLSEVQSFPLFWRIAFYIAAGLLVVSLLRASVVATRIWRQRRQMAESTGVPPAGPVGIHAIGSDMAIFANTASFGRSRQLLTPVEPGSVPSTSEDLARLSNALRSLHDEMLSAVTDPFYFDLRVSSQELTEQIQTANKEVMTKYWTSYAGRVVFLYEEARARGYGDAELEDSYQNPTNPTGVREVAIRLGALSMRLAEASDQLDNPRS